MVIRPSKSIIAVFVIEAVGFFPPIGKAILVAIGGQVKLKEALNLTEIGHGVVGNGLGTGGVPREGLLRGVVEFGLEAVEEVPCHLLELAVGRGGEVAGFPGDQGYPPSFGIELKGFALGDVPALDEGGDGGAAPPGRWACSSSKAAVANCLSWP